MIPQLLLEEILLGEKNESDYYDKYGKEEIQTELAKLKKSNDEILLAYPMENMQDKIIEKAFAEKNNVKTAKKTYSAVWKFSIAAVLIFAIASPILLNNHKNQQVENSIHLKGTAHHQIRLYRQSGNEAQLLKNGESASENDLIQITYTPGEYNYGVIFSVDGNGKVTRHFPENSWTAESLEKTGEEVPLSFSYHALP